MGLTIKTFHKIIQVLCVVLTAILLTVPAIANEDKKLIELYEQFNSKLINSGFSEANRLLSEDNIKDSMKILKSADIDFLKSFYSEKFTASHEKCYSRSLCRESDLIFLSVLAFTEYEVVSLGKINGKSRKMGISGIDGGAVKIKLVIEWLHEDDKWKIDKLVKVPINWNLKFK